LNLIAQSAQSSTEKQSNAMASGKRQSYRFMSGSLLVWDVEHWASSWWMMQRLKGYLYE
jgi:hypothetical protein